MNSNAGTKKSLAITLVFHQISADIIFVLSRQARVLALFVKNQKKRMQAATKKKASKYRARKRILSWVIDRNNETEGPKLWSAPEMRYKDILLLFMGRNGAFIEPDGDLSYDFSFTTEGQGIGLKYLGMRKDDQKTPLHADPNRVKAWKKFVAERNFEQIMTFYSYDQIKAYMLGEDLDENSPPSKSQPEQETFDKKVEDKVEEHMDSSEEIESTEEESSEDSPW